jgi:hypothetical protein
MLNPQKQKLLVKAHPLRWIAHCVKPNKKRLQRSIQFEVGFGGLSCGSSYLGYPRFRMKLHLTSVACGRTRGIVSIAAHPLAPLGDVRQRDAPALGFRAAQEKDPGLGPAGNHAYLKLLALY